MSICRRKWQPTPVFLPGKSHGHRSLAGYSPWDPKESDTTEYTHMCKSNIGIKFSTIRNKVQNRKRDVDVQNRLLDSVGEGEGGMFRENSIETSIVSRVKQITSPGWMIKGETDHQSRLDA